MDNGHFFTLKNDRINIKNEWIIGLKKWKGTATGTARPKTQAFLLVKKTKEENVSKCHRPHKQLVDPKIMLTDFMTLLKPPLYPWSVLACREIV